MERLLNVSPSRIGSSLLSVTLVAGFFLHGPLLADPHPPTWTGLGDCGTAGAACHFAPAPWPDEPANPVDCGATCGEWQPYTRFQAGVTDPRTQDPSNGGTRPQNYVNIASSCIDRSLPSIYYALVEGAAADGSEDVILFRWRVEQIAHTYATGPSAGSARSSDPWSSALWTVLFDVDGDGIRDLAAHLDGSSGGPAEPVDAIAGIWGDVPTQSIDYLDDPSIHRIAHNPTAFVDGGTGGLLNFQNRLAPAFSWPNGAAETLWDYGTTRARRVSTSTCTEYFIDYQIPVAMLDASGLGGPKIDRTTPLAMLFCTANSLNDPFQKDCAIDKTWSSSPSRPAPFGDFVSFDLGAFEQPIVDRIDATGCGVFDLRTSVKDTIAIVDGEAARTVGAVDFYAYRDADGSGMADDAGDWFPAASGTPDAGALAGWSATWDATGLLDGQYLLGVQAVDDPDPALLDDGMTSDGVAHRTFSYLTAVEIDALGAPPAGEEWFANPAATGVQSVAVAVNACGVPTPFVDKSFATASDTAGEVVQATVTIHNTLDSGLAVTEIVDHLPDGFAYVSTDGGTLSPTGTPAADATGDVAWSYSPAATIPAGGAGSLVFSVRLPSVTGTYQNRASAATGFAGEPLTSDPAPIAVGAPRLSLSKTAAPLAAQPGETIDFTLVYANDSPVDVTGAAIADFLPEGLSFVAGSASGPATFDAGTGTLAWDLGTLPSGAGGSVTFSATVDDPFPAGAVVPLVNRATIASDQTSPTADEVALFVDVPRPRLALDKSADRVLVDPGADVVFALRYANTGSGGADGVTVRDTIPDGFTFVSADPVATPSGRVVEWSVGSLAAGAGGTVTLTLRADDPFGASVPAVNRATVESAGTDPVTAEAKVGVVQSGQVCETFYFRDQAGDVGAAGTALLATESPVPQPPDAGGSTTVSLLGGAGNHVEAARFYQDPPAPSEVTFSGDLTTRIYIDRDAGPGITLRGTVYDYDSVTGATGQLGQGSASFQGSHTGLFEFTVPLTGTLQNGHRLLWLFEASSNNNQTTDLQIQYGGTVTNALSGAGSTFADSHAAFCVTPPANLVIQKTADAASVVPGQGLAYTIDFANTGETTATGSTLTETLPAGVTFAGATLDGATATPVVSGREHVFTVSSAGAPAGEITGGASGRLTVQVTVDDPLDPSIRELVNAVSLASDQTQPVTAGLTTPVDGAEVPGSPHLVVDKTVSTGALRPGESATYTITVLNAGTAGAASVRVTDDLPETAYYAYAPGSIAGAGADDGDPGLLAWNVGTLTPGAAESLSFAMTVRTAGVPAGTTFLDNVATATREGLAGTVASGPVAVAVRAAPSLALDKLVSPPPPAGFWRPGDTVEYTLTVTNRGDTDALGVQVFDPLPEGTTFGRVSRLGGGSGAFEPDRNRMRFDVGSLAPGASATVGFEVLVEGAIPAGESLIDNRATAVASNAGSVQGAATAAVRAAPALELLKTGPVVLPLPAATVTRGGTDTAVVAVDDAGLLELGGVVRVGGRVASVVELGSTSVTLDRAVTVTIGDPMEAAGVYTLTVRNTGTAPATGVTLTDDLPSGFELHGATPAPTSAPSGPGGVVFWSLGTLDPGAVATIEVTVFATEAGAFTNSGTVSADELSTPVTATAATSVGGLRVRKRTGTPVAAAGGVVAWTIEIENTLSSPVGGITVIDTLPTGFTFRVGTTEIGGAGVGRDPVVEPVDGAAIPSWGTLSIPVGGTATLTFEADVGPAVGAATYQNGVSVTADGAVALPFDPLATTAEDVTVLAGGTGLLEGHVYRDEDGDGTFGIGDVPLAGVEVEIDDAEGTPFVVVTDGSGFFARVVAAGTASVDVGGAADRGITDGLVLAPGSGDPESVAVPAGGRGRADTGFVSPGDLPPPQGSVELLVFHDRDADGVWDPAEPGIPDLAVTVIPSSGPVLHRTTDGAGELTLSVPTGSTRIEVTGPAGMLLTTGNRIQEIQVELSTLSRADDVGFDTELDEPSGIPALGPVGLVLLSLALAAAGLAATRR